jgi:hypothetical protein
MSIMSRNVGASAQPACTKSSLGLEANIVEAWGQGFMVGAIVILILITVSNMRSGILLHKLILLEVSAQQSVAGKKGSSAQICNSW